MSEVNIFAAAKSDVEQHAQESRAFVGEAVKILFRLGLSAADMDELLPLGPFETPDWSYARGFDEKVTTILSSLASRAIMLRQAEDELAVRARAN
jgi:hypothetical protein